MKATPVIDLPDYPAGAIPATREQLLALGLTEAQIDAGEARGTLRHVGPWATPVSYRAPVEAKDFEEPRRARFWPPRTMSNPRQEGYHLEGRVSIAGRQVPAFTSSQLFELPDGRLVNVETIFACDIPG